MRKLALLLVAAVVLTVIGCQPPEGMAGVSQEQFDELKAQVDMLNTDVMTLQTALDSLTMIYNGHIEKFHKASGIKAPVVKPKEKPPAVQK